MEYEEVEVNSERWFNLTPLLNEVFSDIKGYEELYQVSNYGRIKAKEKKNGWCLNCERIMKTHLDKDNYYRITLCKKGKNKVYGVHRLVAQTFIPNLDNLPEVNHIDTIKTNNKIGNLEWCSQDYNLHYADRNKKISKALSMPIIQYTKDNIKIKEYASINEAAKELNLSSTHISECCRNLKYHKTYGGFIWKYKEMI